MAYSTLDNTNISSELMGVRMAYSTLDNTNIRSELMGV